ncbi:winged helix-turn-helix domain-containing protein [Streptomyces sp. HUAS TT7]|uniref:winged helix-turn-helix domain-containing protein n=1 Tax=Streptomyces sp. HUAS TT7 TaxID=3447507 RepID=UPI003F65B679
MTHVHTANTPHRPGGTAHDHRPGFRDALAAPAAERRYRRTRPELRTPAPACATEQPKAPCHRIGRLVVDGGRRRAWVDGRQLRLTCMEFELLAHLAANPGRGFTRSRLMELVWQRSAPGDLETVDTHIDRLRDKLGTAHRPLIRTTSATGYALAADASAPAA